MDTPSRGQQRLTEWFSLSPDTRTLGWDACGGYHYTDSSIIGFSHTHLSGTGISDLGDFLFMPFSGQSSK
jgi:putative alpha-1,2-mannosidase